MNLRFDPKLEAVLETVFSKQNAIQQHEWELRTFLRMVIDDLGPQRTLELGSWKGYTGAILSKVTSDLTVSIDNAEFGKYEDEAAVLGDQIVYIIDNCKTTTAVNRVMALLQKPIDLLFLDDGHSYQDITVEVELWKPHVRPGGWIVFHDINPLANVDNNGKHPENCQVHRFWPEIQGNKTEIIATEQHKQWRGVIPHGGIGVWKL